LHLALRCAQREEPGQGEGLAVEAAGLEVRVAGNHSDGLVRKRTKQVREPSRLWNDVAVEEDENVALDFSRASILQLVVLASGYRNDSISKSSRVLR
jgi:hypothetical protein